MPTHPRPILDSVSPPLPPSHIIRGNPWNPSSSDPGLLTAVGPFHHNSIFHLPHLSSPFPNDHLLTLHHSHSTSRHRHRRIHSTHWPQVHHHLLPRPSAPLATRFIQSNCSALVDKHHHLVATCPTLAQSPQLGPSAVNCFILGTNTSLNPSVTARSGIDPSLDSCVVVPS